MPDDLVTIATYNSPVDANLARNRLLAAGVRAALADEELVGMAWHMTNAVGGVKVQVLTADVGRAVAILEEADAVHRAAEKRTRAEDDPPDESPEELDRLDALPERLEEPPPEAFEEGDEYAAPPPDPDAPAADETRRDKLAERAFRVTLLGILLGPLLAYAFWLLLKVYLSNEPLAAGPRRRAVAAACVCVPLLLTWAVLFRSLFH